MIKEAIILAGGLGTRLRSAVPDLPKCMAPVNGKPFIGYIIEALQKQGVEKFIFSLGYMHEVLEAYFAAPDSPFALYPSLSYQVSIETEPLGTGGGIKLACTKATEKNVLVANGDTLFDIQLGILASFHEAHDADCTLSLKPMHHFDRYGVVTLNEEGAITSFLEKKQYESGLINGGLYALNTQRFLQEDLPRKFSFEKDYLETFYSNRRMFGLSQDAYFIDIGIPEDYQKAQADLAHS